MRPLLHALPVVDEINTISLVDSVEPMRNRNDRRPPRKSCKRILDLLLRLYVQCTSRLIQQQ
jgi:hypothetical protein